MASEMIMKILMIAVPLTIGIILSVQEYLYGDNDGYFVKYITYVLIVCNITLSLMAAVNFL